MKINGDIPSVFQTAHIPAVACVKEHLDNQTVKLLVWITDNSSTQWPEPHLKALREALRSLCAQPEAAVGNMGQLQHSTQGWMVQGNHFPWNICFRSLLNWRKGSQNWFKVTVHLCLLPQRQVGGRGRGGVSECCRQSNWESWESCWVKLSFWLRRVWLIAYHLDSKRPRRASAAASASRGVWTCICLGQLQHRYKESTHSLHRKPELFPAWYCSNSDPLEISSEVFPEELLIWQLTESSTASSRAQGPFSPWLQKEERKSHACPVLRVLYLIPTAVLSGCSKSPPGVPIKQSEVI